MYLYSNAAGGDFSTTVHNNLFDHNNSPFAEPTQSGSGGGAWIKTEEVDSLITIGGNASGEGIKILGNTFANNYAAQQSGGVDALTFAGPITFSNNIVENNTALYSGGLQFQIRAPSSESFTMDGNLISGNISSDNAGGSIYFSNLTSDAVISNNIIVNNHGYTANCTVGWIEFGEQ